jgi:polyphosphate kinase 2 (PPK2 family)
MAGAVQFHQHPSETLRAGEGFSLATVDPDSAPGYSGGKQDGKALLADLDDELSELQEKLFAESRFGGRKRILLILQAMDTAGKGGIVNHVMAAMDPQGVQFKAFKAPTDQEKSYDFLWRIEKEVPAAGMVGVFDRSHYEDVLIHRVHGWATPDEIKRRYVAINEFEARLTDSGRRQGCWPGWTTLPNTGNTTAATSTNGPSGRTTWMPTRPQSTRQAPRTHRGTWSRPTRSGTRA